MKDADGHHDDGFTLIEMLIVIVILGILATVVIVSVRGITDRGEQSSCDTDARTLATAIESYFAEVGGNTIPATGVGADQFERTLVNQGLLREASQLYDVDTNGDLTVVATSHCA